MRALAVLVCLAALSACAPDESSVGAVIADGGAARDGRVPRHGWWPWRRIEPADARAVDELPLSAVTGTAVSSDGVLAGGVSSAPELFWDAWLIPADGAPPRRLAPIGDRLLAVLPPGALWTTVVSEDESGVAAFEVRLSPADGSASQLLSPDLPGAFSADRAAADGDDGLLVAGTEGPPGASHLAAFAVDDEGRARRLSCPPGPASPLIVDAAVAAGGLQIEVQYAANAPSSIVTVPIDR